MADTALYGDPFGNWVSLGEKFGGDEVCGEVAFWKERLLIGGVDEG